MQASTEKMCPQCKTRKQKTEFYKVGRWLSGWCKECLIKLSKERVMDGRNKESRAKYRESHPKPHKERTVRTVIEKPEKIYTRARPMALKLSPLQRLTADTYDNLKKRCLYKGMEFDITKEFLIDIFTEFCNNNYHIFGNKNPFRPSLDRLDNSKGYVRDNVQVIWLIENYCKNSFTDEDVLEFCKRKLNLL